MSGFYAAYHGNDGLIGIAKKIHAKANTLANALVKMGCKQLNTTYFDTLRIALPENCSVKELRAQAESNRINFCYLPGDIVSISVDEATTCEGVQTVLGVFAEVAKEGRMNISEAAQGLWGVFLNPSLYLLMSFHLAHYWILFVK